MIVPAKSLRLEVRKVNWFSTYHVTTASPNTSGRAAHSSWEMPRTSTARSAARA